MSRIRPIKAPEQGLSQAEELAAEARYLQALKARYPTKIAEIQRLFRAGASRRSLIARFGQDLADLAIAELADPG